MKQPSQHKYKVKYKDLYLKCVNCGTEEAFDTAQLDSNPSCRVCQGTLGLHSNERKREAFSQITELPELPKRRKTHQDKAKGVDIIDDEQGFDIMVNHFQSTSKVQSLFLLFFTVIWIGSFFMIPFQAMMIFHYIAGAFLLTKTMSNFLNSTNIRITDLGLEISTTPISLSGTKTIPHDQVRQVYVKRHVHRSDEGRVTYSYELLVTKFGDKDISVFKTEDLNTALYLEQEIENYLGIRDESVAGEHLN